MAELSMLLKKPVLHPFYAIGHEPGGTVIPSREMCKQQMSAVCTHLIRFFRKTLSGKCHVPCSLRDIISETAPQLHSLPLKGV